MRVIALSLLLSGLAFEVHANYTLQIGNVTWSGSPNGYNCFSSTEYPNTVNFTITKTKSGNRSYAVTAGPSANTLSYTRQLANGASRLDYQLYTTSARSYVLKAPPVANANEVISDTVNYSVGTVIPLQFTFFIPPNQLVEPGTYTDQITVSIYDRYNDTAPPFDTRTITFSVTVAAGAALAVVPTGSGFSTTTSQNLDFGELLKDKSMGCDLLIKKNTGCNITFSSLHEGVMKAIPTPTTDYVPYTCKVNGSAINLSSPAMVALPTGVSPSLDGNRLSIDFTIGDLGNAAAGDYQDEITISVATQ